MPKFFIQTPIVDAHVTVSGSEAGHLIHALRAKPGDEVVLCDGAGYDYPGVIAAIHKDSVEIKLSGQQPNDAEPSVKVTLFQGLPKSGKMDYIIQKAVELGVYEIVPVLTDRTIVKLDGNRQKKIDRFKKIAEAAAKQSMRGIVPAVTDFLSVEDAVAYGKHCDLLMAPYENEHTQGIRDVLHNKTPVSVGVMIGPEGGFSPREVELFQKNQLPLVTLGRRILRTETAGLAAIIMILYQLEAL